MSESGQELRRQITENGDDGLGDAFHRTAQQTAGSDDAEQTFRILQDGTEYEIAALDSADFGGRTVEEFYGYDDGEDASANTPNEMEQAELSQLFFYDGPEATSLVVIHDEPNTGSGGTVVFDFETLPEDGEWAVPDDPWDTGYDSGRVRWNWFRCCTDGGIYKGGFETPFWTEITPETWRGIDSSAYDEPWVAVDGSDGDLDRVPLDPTKPITITSAGKLHTDTEEAEYALDISSDVCVDVGGEESVCVSSEPIVELGPRRCEGVSTPPLASVEIPYVQEEETEDGVTVTFEANFWVGFELQGEPCIWYGEEDLGICAKLDGCTVPPEPTPEGVPAPDAVLELAEDIVDDLMENVPGGSFPSVKQILLSIVFVGVAALILLGAPIEAVGAVAFAAITILVAGDDEEDDDERDG